MDAIVVDAENDITDFLQQGLDRKGTVKLPVGRFLISRTILLPSECRILGSGTRETVLVLADGVNNNMFTNRNHREGNTDITFENLKIDGNMSAQRRPPEEKRLSFCNIVYFANATNCRFLNLHISNVYQTALHFRTCRNVEITSLYSAHLGWSGVSTSGTDNIVAKDIKIIDSGNDHRHSAIHLDGGNCTYVSGEIDGCVGNGVMLDSSHGKLTNCVVEVKVSNCMRGVALIGSAENQTSTVLVTRSEFMNNDIGVMVSNAFGAFIDNSRIENNREFGILFQGRVGGFDSFVTNCTLVGNTVQIKEIHQSRNNLFINNTFVD